MSTPANIHETLRRLVVPVSDLHHYGRNPRKGDVAAIAESLLVNGQYKPIVVRTGTMEVLAGTHTLKAARELGWDEIAATFVDVDDDAAARIVLVDNRTNDLAEYDEDALAIMLSSLPDLVGTGFDQDAVDELVHGIEQEPADAPDSVDEVPATAEDPIARPGDVIELGEHRVICGDSTDPATLEALMGPEEVAACMWTDPPYGVDYQVGLTPEKARAARRRTDGLVVANDAAADLDSILSKGLGNALKVLRPGAPVYIAGPQGPLIAEFQRHMVDAGFLWRQTLIWVKSALVLGRSDYQNRHEPILAGQAPEPDPVDDGDAGKDHTQLLYGFAPGGEGRLGRGGPRWYGGNAATTVFEVDKPGASREHPTMKPVKLILAMLANSVRPGQIVLDPFAGSGSTLIAAHYHGARARVVELDPRFVDVICARYQKETGDMPRRGGAAVSFIREGA